MWSKDSNINSAIVIGTRIGGLFRLVGHQAQALVHNFYRSTGIKREFTVPYNPQPNRVTERKNISIIEPIKAVIHDQ